ncbi:MAG: zf-HC2 domain-containing protein [Bryobacteraceae bacterium]|nr:zf-HC2 domain-containing protein [Bryobacteraceae bacterium]
MLTCDQFLQELSDYLDEEVREDVRRELEKHMAECPNCWVMVDTTKKTLSIYKKLEPDPLPEPLKARLMQAIQTKIKSAEGG